MTRKHFPKHAAFKDKEGGCPKTAFLSLSLPSPIKPSMQPHLQPSKPDVYVAYDFFPAAEKPTQSPISRNMSDEKMMKDGISGDITAFFEQRYKSSGKASDALAIFMRICDGSEHPYLEFRKHYGYLISYGFFPERLMRVIAEDLVYTKELIPSIPQLDDVDKMLQSACRCYVDVA